MRMVILAILVCFSGMGLVGWKLLQALELHSAAAAVTVPPPLPSPPVDPLNLPVPLQTDTRRQPFDFHGAHVIPRADYDITGRVLSLKHYSLDDVAFLAPEDLALGWGRLSDFRYRETLHISQGGRWYRYHYQGAPPMPQAEIVSSSSNNHIIPANDNVAQALGNVREGNIVHIRGMLINARWSGHYWNTSLVRTDTGDGSCEVLFAEAIEVVQ